MTITYALYQMQLPRLRYDIANFLPSATFEYF